MHGSGGGSSDSSASVSGDGSSAAEESSADGFDDTRDESPDPSGPPVPQSPPDGSPCVFPDLPPPGESTSKFICESDWLELDRRLAHRIVEVLTELPLDVAAGVTRGSEEKKWNRLGSFRYEVKSVPIGNGRDGTLLLLWDCASKEFNEKALNMHEMVTRGVGHNGKGLHRVSTVSDDNLHLTFARRPTQTLLRRTSCGCPTA